MSQDAIALIEKYGLSVVPIDYLGAKWFVGIFNMARGYFDVSVGIIDGKFDYGTFAMSQTLDSAVNACVKLIEERKSQ
jgi:hypothetical protein